MIVADITMSLDGYVTGPEPGPGEGLGRGGKPLHAWAFDASSEVDARVLREAVESTGAVVMGRRTFEVVDAPGGWSEDIGYGGRHATTPPVFVVTHRAPDLVRLTSRFTFVTEGLEAAIERARAASGKKNVVVMGGGDVVRQSVGLELVDELRIHLAPNILGAGTPLFGDGQTRQLVQHSVQVSRLATHLTYRVATT
jgi:dihydrofolate reductase